MPDTPQFDELSLEILKAAGGGYQAKLVIPGYNPGWSHCDDSLWNQASGKLEFLFTNDRPADGARIFKWLTQDANMQKAWIEAKAHAPQRRIRLELDQNSPELAQVPWELLNDPDPGGGWVAGASAMPFSRLLVGGFDPAGPVLERPLRILVVIAKTTTLPDGTQPIDDPAFWERIETATRDLVEIGQVHIQRLADPVTLEGLEAELQKGYHILHFVGHGAFKPDKGGAFLYIRHQKTKKDFVSAADFAAMIGRGIQDVKALGRPNLRMISLASCQTAVSGLLDIFSSLAMQLGVKGLPAILAMQDLVGMDAALEFTTRFYQRLLTHGLVDLAANEARQALLTAHSSDAHVPVLFSRLKDNQLLQPVKFKLPKESQPFEPEMVRIPAGKFFMGANPADQGAVACENPAEWISLPAYWIGKFPVTNQEYAVFIQDSGRPAPRLNWVGQQPEIGKERYPVVGVTWHDAQAYCQWLTERTGRFYRLPSEAEWEKAARGDKDQRIYPWGDLFDPNRCRQDPAYPPQVIEVDRYEAQTPYGCFDMAGNVREWTNTIWGESLHASKSRFPYPWQDDEREEHETARRYFKIYRILRGGGAGDGDLLMRCSARDLDSLDARFQCGLRVARD
jgi:formylglycine-generating enzyme required for sulfatase activity